MGYDGFISYSHAADGKLAPALQDGLQKLAKPWYRRRALHLFRDDTGLSANPGLWTSITAAMDDSDHFVLLASPEAAESPWVNREIEHWREHKDVSRLLPVVTAGEWVWDEERNDFDWAASSAVPAALAGVFVEEPRHLDMRWAHTETDLDLRNSRFRDQVAELAAPMHGMAKDELEGADIRAHRRARRLAAAAVALLVLLTLSSGAAALLAKRNADEAQRNEIRAIAAQGLADENAEEAAANADQAEANADEADRQRNQAEANADEAESNAAEAEANAAEADRQRNQAEANAGQARLNADEARANAAEADRQRNQAEANADQAISNAQEADRQRAQALAFAQEADRQRAVAEAQRLLAEQNEAEARRQEAIAEQNAAEAERQAAIAEERADELGAEQLAAQALLEKDGHLDRALLLAVEAVRVGGPEHLGANSALLEVIQEANGVEQFLPLPPALDGSRDFLAVAASPDGERIAASDGHDVVVWTLSGAEVVDTLLIDPGEELVTSLEFPREDRLIGNLSTNLTLPGIRLWDAATGSELGRWGNDEGTGLEDASSVHSFVGPGAHHLIVQEFEQIYLYGLSLAWAQAVDLETGATGFWWYGQAKATFDATGRYAVFTDWFGEQHTIWDLQDDQLTSLYDWSSPSPEFDSAGQVAWGVDSGWFVAFDPPTGDLLDAFPVGFLDLADGAYDSTTQTVALLEVVDDDLGVPPSAALLVFDVPTGSFLDGWQTDPCSRLVDTSPTGLWFYTTARTSELNDPTNFHPYCWQSAGARDATEVFHAPSGGYVARLDGANEGGCRRAPLGEFCFGSGAFFQGDRFAFQNLVVREGSRTVQRLAVYDLFAGQGGALIWSDEATDVDVTWSADRTFVASSSDGTSPGRLWRFDGTGDGQPVALEGSLSVRELQFVGSRLVGVGADSTAVVWDASANRSASEVDAMPGIGPGGWATIAPDGGRLAYSTGDGVVRLRDLGGGGEQVVATLGPGEALYLESPFSLFGTDSSTPLLFSADGSRLFVNVVTALGERVGRIYDPATNQLVGSVPEPVVASSADGSVLVAWDVYAPLPCATCQPDVDIRLYRTADQSLVRTVPILADYPTEVFAAAALSPDGSLLATSGRKGLIVVWDVATGAVVVELDTYGAADAGLGEQQLAWSPTGDRLLYAAGNSLADDVENYHQWSSTDWSLLARVDLERADFDSFADAVRYSPDGTRIVTPQGYVLDGRSLRPLGGRLLASPDLPGYEQTPVNVEIAFRSGSELVMLSRHRGPADDLVQLTSFGLAADAALGCDLAGRNLSQLEWSRYFPEQGYRSTCSQHPPGA